MNTEGEIKPGLKIHAALVREKTEARSLFVSLSKTATKLARIDDGFIVGSMQTPDSDEPSYHLIAVTNRADVVLNRNLQTVIDERATDSPILSGRALLNRFMREMDRGNSLIPVEMRPTLFAGRVLLWCANGLPDSVYTMDPSDIERDTKPDFVIMDSSSHNTPSYHDVLHLN